MRPYLANESSYLRTNVSLQVRLKETHGVENDVTQEALLPGFASSHFTSAHQQLTTHTTVAGDTRATALYWPMADQIRRS
ncbi:putative Fanconi-associated nuclease 1 like protein [Fusarium oxysporum f. sp. albedinis]|nr:putative Fanconi-associated nuclease 1 like protein [Fusarium oxysporum f. sp. albedinis]